MFENLRDKILNVQYDLSASFRNLATGETQSSKGNQKNYKGVSVNAGARLLHYYEKQWEELHDNNVFNAKKAEEADALIGSLHNFCYGHLSTIRTLNNQLAALPKLQTGILDLMSKIGELEGVFEEVEDALINLEDVIEIQDLQERQLDHRFQLAMYKEKKLADFEDMKVKLDKEHSSRVMEYEKKHNEVLKERQHVFQDAFDEQLKMYKTSGKNDVKIRRERNLNQSISLEEIDLDEDNSVLDEFLEDVTLDGANVENELEGLNGNETSGAETDVAMDYPSN